MKWKYTRIKSSKCSKWVCGDNWVVKYDGNKYCNIGINGNAKLPWMIEWPKDAREFIEKEISQTP